MAGTEYDKYFLKPQLLSAEQREKLYRSFWRDEGMSEGYSNMIKPP